LVHNDLFRQEWSADRVGMRCSVRAMRAVGPFVLAFVDVSARIVRNSRKD
jgi:hypothetical protein